MSILRKTFCTYVYIPDFVTKLVFHIDSMVKKLCPRHDAKSLFLWMQANLHYSSESSPVTISLRHTYYLK